jgi:uncharacterized membrane protein
MTPPHPAAGAAHSPGHEVRPRSLALPGILLGAGLGGFVDGIVLHQLLQWHHMLTSTDTDRVGIPYYPRDTVHGLEINTLWDGVFHVCTWLLILTGLASLFARTQDARGQVWRGRALWSWVLVGSGLFNLVEGLVDHQVLGIHHVRSGEHQVAWDFGFLALGALLVLGGRLLGRGAAESRTAPVRPSET